MRKVLLIIAAVCFSLGAFAQNECTNAGYKPWVYGEVHDSAGVLHQRICVDSNANLITLSPTCTGTGCTPPPVVQPTITVSSSALTFPATNTGQTATPQVITITNSSTSGASVLVSGVALTTGTQFSQTNSCGTIASSGSCVITVTFAPTATGAQTDTLTITDNASGSPQTVSLSGTGQTPATPTASSGTVLPASPSVAVGATASEAATLTMSDSTTRTPPAPYWNSATPSVGTIAQTGVFTGVAAGTSVIAANLGSPVQATPELTAGVGPFTTETTAQFPKPITVGDTIIVPVGWGSASNAVSSITDTLGNTYTEANATCFEQANGNTIDWWIATGSPAGADAITVNWTSTGAAFPDILGIEVNGSTTFDQCVKGTAASGTAAATSAATPAQASETFFGAVITGNAVKNVGAAGAYCITAGGVGQNNISGSACPVSGNGSSTFWQGLFSTSSVTPTANLNSSSTWVASALFLKTVSANTTATVTSNQTSYSLASPPAAGFGLYASGSGANGQHSIFNNVVPGNCYDSGVSTCPTNTGILTHCFGNTSVCATAQAFGKFAMTANNGCTGSPEACGFFEIYPCGTCGKSNSSSDTGDPIYYSTAADPWYSITIGSLNLDFHAPSGATFGGTGANGTDQALVVYDNAQGVLLEMYVSGKGVGFSLPVSTCTSSVACAQVISGIPHGQAARQGIDADFNANQTYKAVVGGNTYTLGTSSGSNGLGIQALGTTLRFAEMSAASINHAIQIALPCGHPLNGTSKVSSDWVFPATSGLNPCSTSASNQVSAGAHFVFDYTQSQINAMGLDPLNKALIVAMSRYGFFFSVTGGGNSAFTGPLVPGGGGAGGVESQEAYKFAGVTNSSMATVNANNPNWLTCTGNTVSDSCFGDVFKAIGKVTGPGGTDAENNSCSTGCYPSGHVVQIDPCIDEHTAGVSGGCTP